MAEFDLVIRNGTVATASDTTDCDIGIKNGVIAIMGRGLAAGPVAVPPGLVAAIASTVDANWRSIGRDCSAVAPRSRSLEPLNVAVTVTIDVAAAGQVLCRGSADRARPDDDV